MRSEIYMERPVESSKKILIKLKISIKYKMIIIQWVIVIFLGYKNILRESLINQNSALHSAPRRL